MSAPEFPIPYPNQEPEDELFHAMNLLEVISWTFDNGLAHGITSDTVSDLYAVLSDAKSSLMPVREFLSQLDYPELTDDYRKARRAVILQTWEARA